MLFIKKKKATDERAPRAYGAQAILGEAGLHLAVLCTLNRTALPL